MEVVKINAIEVAPGTGGQLEERFARRAAEVEKMAGFRGFELLRPTAGETRYFVYTRWESEEHFQAWVGSSAFTRGHAQSAAASGGPVATHSDLLSFEVVQRVVSATA
jgi:heme-degrading monooxygenase HmoA